MNFEIKTDKYKKIGEALGDIVDDKQVAYGNSFHLFHQLLEILYPHGILSKDYPNALAIIRVLDKLCRLSRGHSGGEDAWRDIAGYALLMAGEQETG